MLLNSNAGHGWSDSPWKIWVDTIMSQQKALGILQTSLVHKNGAIASATNGGLLPKDDILTFRKYFQNRKTGDAIKIHGKTFIIKKIDPLQIVAFAGSNYIIISRSQSMYIVANCIRPRADEAARWIRRVNNKLIEKDY